MNRKLNAVKTIIPKLAQGKYFELVFDIIALFSGTKEINFEDIFKDSVNKAFKSHKHNIIQRTVKAGRRISEQAKEYENYKFDVQLLLKNLRRKNQWESMSKRVFEEDIFVKNLSPFISELLGNLRDLTSDGSDESAAQISRNIAKLIREKLIEKINTNQQLFNECLKGELNKLKDDNNETFKAVKEVLIEIGIFKKNVNKIMDMLKELYVKSSKEHKDTHNAVKGVDHKVVEIMHGVNVLLESRKFDFPSFINWLEAKLESKTWPDSIREIVLSNIYDVLNKFRVMGEQKVCRFIKATLLEVFPFLNKNIKLSENGETVMKIVKCIALIRIIYPDLELCSKTAQSLNIDGCRSVCLIHTYKDTYKGTITKLWKYIIDKQPELKGVFRIIVGNQACTFCKDKKKGANLKDVGLEYCLADFMRVIASEESKPEYNDLQVDLEQIGFHCEYCLGSYELTDNFQQYRKTLCSIFGEEE